LVFGLLHIRPQGPLSTNGFESDPPSGRDGREACKVLASRGATIVRLPLLNVIAAYAGIVDEAYRGMFWPAESRSADGRE
jgi:hypothetical protein